ncbi:2,3-diaminopropionate biosynthesis protein SbnB [Pseudomonas syringae group genomosp. 3]|uniref:Ornithine cyclodeaminase/mu-crystallin n=1 Tax=Pseudomonas syringae pv. viburni TaxID=251703 RepID=A0A0Q0DD17_9PSED|nr:2,3-diaminopropionate biosynthesis protein SbnB [Pseudomonas syringae group genomosp. 3]KPZ16395.1 Ornithine cyclodeaminase/mu-crystallin [Pseudomonas syringae pv. viburni]POD76535.1 2,3-diaminopropionate biosynthesis protein SbnB [Pseudomonas syringae group genomosp. 3]
MNAATTIQAFHVVPGAVVKTLLSGLRKEAITLVAQTYLTHERGETVNPDSYFLRFPSEPANRIIALPAAIVDANGGQSVSGIKWIASYPDNIKSGIPRASATLILNNPDTGYPYALLEGALISAVRTAASAVLGAWWLNNQQRSAPRLSIVGGGVISRNILETFREDDWSFGCVEVHDLNEASADALSAFGKHIGFPEVKTVSLDDALTADIVVFATSAGTPYVTERETFRAGQVVLNISLRDIGPDIIAQSYNYFDDVTHCLKANTSPHLAELKYGHREFVTGTVAALIRGDIHVVRDKPLIYSPFGMGILDLALGRMVHDLAVRDGSAIAIPSFFGEERRW